MVAKAKRKMTLAFHCRQFKIRRTVSCLQCHNITFALEFARPFYCAAWSYDGRTRGAEDG
jgi:hypothetical protein